MKNIPVRQIKDSFAEHRFSIRAIEPLVTKGDLIHDHHRHDFYFVLFVKSGSGEHVIDFISHPVSDHSVFFIRPGQVHQLRLAKGSAGYMLQFTPDFYAPREQPAAVVLRKVSNKSHCQLSHLRFERMEGLLQSIAQEFDRKEERFKEVIHAILHILFIELLRQSRNPNQTEPPTRLYAQERLEELMDLLERHIHTHKQVSAYADMLHMTPYQLNAITKDLLQKTCSDLINEQIILEARRLLTGTSNQVNQIAEILGYHDPSYFIRFFKKHTGLTPEAMRQNFR